MQEILDGVIVERDGTYAKLRPKRHSECDDCQACFSTDLLVLAYNPGGFEVGQQVHYVQAQHGMLLIAWVLFVQPLLAVFAGIGLGSLVAPLAALPPAAAMTMGALFLFGLAVAFVLWFDRRYKLKQTNFARITEGAS